MTNSTALAKKIFIHLGWKRRCDSSFGGARNIRVVENRKRWLIFGLILLCLAGNGWADESVTGPLVEFNIPQQRADLAVTEFAEQADLTLIVPHDLVQGKQANELIGTYTLQEGIALLLEGTGLAPLFSHKLVLSIVSTNSIVIENSTTTRGEGMKSKTKRSLLASLLAAWSGGHALAQNVDPDDQVIELEEIIVTGSRIQNIAPTSQLTIIGRDELELRNIQSVDEALSLLLQNNSGITARAPTSNTSSGSGINNFNQSVSPDLRGIGSGATLTLLNGAPVTASALAQGASNFSDIGDIPAIAIERIEVFNDSASAIYGTDAIGGVVNIITRKDYEGLQLNVSYDDNGKGEPTTVASLFGGTSGEGWSMLGGLSYRKTDATTYRDLGRSNRDYRAQGGLDFRLPISQPGVFESFFGPIPGVGSEVATVQPGSRDVVTLADLRPGRDSNSDIDEEFTGEAEAYSLFLHGDAKLGGSTEVTIDLISSTQDTVTDDGAPSTFAFLFGFEPILAGFPPDSFFGTFTYDFENEAEVGLIPRTTRFSQTDKLSVNVGLNGDFSVLPNGKWNLNTSYSRDEQTLEQDSINDILTVGAFDGTLDPRLFSGDGRNTDPALFSALGLDPRLINDSATSLLAINANVQGELATLPGGTIVGLVGAEYREDASRSVGSNVQGVGDNLDLVNKVSRSTSSVFSEISIPLVGENNALPGIKSLLLTGAVRYADYSGVDEATVYRLGTAWELSDWLSVTASYGTSFRAPSVFDLSEPTEVDNDFFQDLGCPMALATGEPCFPVVQLTSGGNAGLESEEGESTSVGFTFRPPVNGLVMGVNYNAIDFTNRIVNPVGEFRSEFVTANTELFPGIVVRDEFGNLVALNLLSVNFAETISRSYDVSASYQFEPAMGQLSLAYSGTYQQKLNETIVPGSPTLELAGTSFRGPQWRHRVSAVLVPSGAPNASISLDINVLPGYDHIIGAVGRDRSTGEGNLQKVDSFTTVDLFLSYQLEKGDSPLTSGWGASIAVRNLLDEETPFLNSILGFDSFNGDPFGRSFSFSLTKDF